MGDYRQIAPVVVRGNMASVIQASMISSPLWHHFRCREFTKNMRLLGLHAHGEVRDPAILAHIREQQEYAAMLLEVGDGVSSEYRVQALESEPETGSTLVRLPLITPITNHQDALRFIYPSGFDKHTMHKASILASTNEIGDEWNTMIQDLNPNESREYLSADFFDAVDDPHKHIAGMMSTEVLNDFYHSGVPSHKLVLKVDDICIVLRNINRRDGLSNNTRVRIVALGQFSIRVKTLDANPKFHVMSRIRFQFALPWGHEVGMTRTQFALRLAYCMTFNKAQGQEWDRVLVDLRNPAFTHGHLYVVLSRIRLSCNIRAFCDNEHVIQEHPITRNVVYTALKIVVNNDI